LTRKNRLRCEASAEVRNPRKRWSHHGLRRYMRPRRELPRRSCRLEHNQSRSLFILFDKPSSFNPKEFVPWRAGRDLRAHANRTIFVFFINRFVENPVKDAGNVAGCSFFSATCTDCTQMCASAAARDRTPDQLTRRPNKLAALIGVWPTAQLRAPPLPDGASLPRRQRVCAWRERPAAFCL
jgi:hypothetical protein